MKICSVCSAQNTDEATTCVGCNAVFVLNPVPLQQAPQVGYNYNPNQAPQGGYNYNPYIKYGETQNTTGMLIWSIVNLVLCSVFGIIGLIFTLQAKGAIDKMTFDKNIKIAKILNIVISCLFGALVLFYIIYFIILFTASGIAAVSYY